MIIDCISDLHGNFPKMKGGDLLIIAGDCTYNDSVKAWKKYFDWIDSLEYKKIVMIAGNHDNFCEQWCKSDDDIYETLVDRPSVDYLCDSGTEFEGLKIWGSPWTGIFPGINPKCCAFTLNFGRGNEYWEKIPLDTNILITHSPPFGMLDKNYNGVYCGSKSLSDRILKLKDLKLHVFGHIHESYGQCHGAYYTPGDARDILKDASEPIGHLSVNASFVNQHYIPVNDPIRVIL